MEYTYTFTLDRSQLLDETGRPVTLTLANGERELFAGLRLDPEGGTVALPSRYSLDLRSTRQEVATAMGAIRSWLLEYRETNRQGYDAVKYDNRMNGVIIAVVMDLRIMPIVAGIMDVVFYMMSQGKVDNKVIRLTHRLSIGCW